MGVSREEVVEAVGEILMEEHVEACDIEDPEDFCERVAHWVRTCSAWASDEDAPRGASMVHIENAMESDEVQALVEDGLSDEDGVDPDRLQDYVEALGVLKEMASALNDQFPRSWPHPAAASASAMAPR